MPRIAELFETMEYGPAPESAASAEAWLEAHGRRFGHLIGGDWLATDDGSHFRVESPASGAFLAEVAEGSREDVDRAVESARSALEEWRGIGAHARARHLYSLARGIQKHARLFSVLESLDNGKPIRESRDLDIPLVARHFYHHAGWAQLLEREFPGLVPHGVVGQIIPWNFPLLMLAWKVAPALAAGNTVVLKPAEFTPLTALLFGELTLETGLPPGVFNLVTGDGRTGAALVEHPEVRKIAFTGSTEVGRIIREATAGSGKRLSLELGGKSPFLVFDDSDLDSVVEGVVDAIWFNQGQVCCAGSRILVQEGIAAELERKLKARMETLRMGDPLDKGIDMGAIVAPVQLDRIRGLVDRGIEEGANVWQPSWAVPEEGLFYPPTLCTDVAPSGTLAQIEIFGPVVVMMTFRTPKEAIELANNTRFGLAASIWTESVNLALDVAPKVKAGTVWVNCTNLFDAASGFGGYRESGFGREGGREGMFEYLRPAWEDSPAHQGASAPGSRTLTAAEGAPVPAPAPEGSALGIDRTVKLYIGGKQCRPDGGYSSAVVDPDGHLIGTVALGNRKDLRNAVEAARKAEGGWSRAPAHLRAQVLYYMAENLAPRRAGIMEGLVRGAGLTDAAASAEFDLSIERLFEHAALADKWDGRVHATPFRNVTLAMVEPLGVIGIAAPAVHPLLALISTIAPAVAQGNAVVALPSETYPLVTAELIQLLETSDVPGGVVNLVTGPHAELVPVLADHDDVDGIWYFGEPEGRTEVERRSAGNMKRSWVPHGRPRNWLSSEEGSGDEFLRAATQIKNVWVPYGE